MVTKVQPINPAMLREPGTKALEIPSLIVMIVNKMIDEFWDGHQSRVWQSDILVRIAKLAGFDKETVVRNRWLDIEPMYREAGYNVKYVKPPHGEKGDAYFEFTLKDK